MSVLKRPACLKRPAAAHASEGDDETSGEEAGGKDIVLYKDGSPFENRLAAFRKDTADINEAEEIAPLLNKYFSKDEQRNLYNKCRRSINGADTQVKAIWEQICNRGRNANKEKDKRGILALQVAKPSHWTKFVVSQHESLVEEEEKKVESEWMCRGELIGKVGEDTALKWIAKGKLEKGEDSDGDSVYRKKRKLETSGTKHQKEYKSSKAGDISREDEKNLAASIHERFHKNKSGDKKQGYETDQQRLLRLKEEEKIQKKQEREEKKKQKEEEKLQNQSPMDVAREKAAAMMKIMEKTLIDAGIKMAALRGQALAKQFLNEYQVQDKRLKELSAQIRSATAPTSSSPGKVQELLAKAGAAVDKKKAVDKLARPFLK